MVKKGAVEKTSKKSMSKTDIEQVLIDNFVNLQKVLTNLSVRFDELSNNISKLLQLFEISAKSFTEKYSDLNTEDMAKKVDNLLDQNKTIARGIMLIEEKLRTRENFSKPMPRNFGY